jgi:hypothetical protein
MQFAADSVNVFMAILLSVEINRTPRVLHPKGA